MIVVGASVVVGLLGVWAAGQLQAKYDSGFDPYNQNVVRMNGMTEVRRHIGDAQQSVASGRAGIANREIQLALEDYLNVKDGLRGTLPADSDPEQVLRGALENRNKGQRAQLLGQADEASRNARESFANNARVISGIQRSDLTISKYARWVGIFGFAGAAGAVVESGVRFVRGRRNDNNRQGRWRGPNLRGLASRDRRKRPKR